MRRVFCCGCAAAHEAACTRDAGVKESDTGLAAPSLWDLVADKQMMQEEQPLQVARCTKIINPGQEDAKYMINVKHVRAHALGGAAALCAEPLRP